MRVALALFAAVMSAMLADACHGGTDNTAGVLRDSDGNPYSVRDMRGGRTWMIDNLRLAQADSYCYGGSTSRCTAFGRLYTWSSAAQACSLFGDGWHLPTDDEWRQMASGYGGVRGDSPNEGQSAYAALLMGGGSGFGAKFGGDRDPAGHYERVEEHGFYWTATESDEGHAWFYNFGRGGGLLNRHSGGDKLMALSVRCVRGS